MLDVSGIGSRSEALRKYYAAVNNDGYKLTQDDLNYLKAKWGIEEDELDEVVFDVVLDDKEVKDAKKAGKKEARKETWDDTTGAVGGAAGTAANIGLTIASCTVGAKGGEGLVGKISKIFEKGNNAGKGLAWVALAMAVLSAIVHLLMATAMGKTEQIEAIKKEMLEAQNLINQNRNEILQVGNDILAQQEAAGASVAAGQDEITKLVEDYFLHKKDYDDAVAKRDSGQELSPAEQQIIDKYAGVATIFDRLIDNISGKVEAEQNGFKAAIAALQGKYEVLGDETLGLVSDTTAATKIVENAKATSKTNLIASGANILSATISTARLIATYWATIGLAILAGALGASVILMEAIAMNKERENIQAADGSMESVGTTTDNALDTVVIVNTEAEGAQMIYDDVDANNHINAKEG